MSAGQRPYLVDWAITRRCNLSCRHCRGMSPDELCTEEAERVISDIAALEPGWVIIEGGEPLLRDDLFFLLQLMKEKQLEVYLISNATLLGAQTQAALKSLGIKLMISLDGATAATFEAIRSGASFEAVVGTARRCAEDGLLDALNFTISRLNYGEIPGILELASSLGVGQVIFIGLKPCQGYLEQLLTPQEYGEAVALACRAAEANGVEFFFDEPFFWAVVREQGLPPPRTGMASGIVEPSASACIFGDYLFIEPSGEVKPCSFAPMALGQVREKPLTEIWEEALASPFLRRLKDPQTRSGHCHTCKYLVECKGCRSRTFILSGDWFAADPACPLSLDQEVR